MKLTLKSPLKFFYKTQKFGENTIPHYKEIGMLGHNGIDLYAPDGTPVFATHDGRITFAGYDSAGGLGIVIRTEDKYDYYNPKTGKLEPSYFKTIYWHLKKGSLKVTGGQNVKAGEMIALADNTGLSTGSHLHFALKPIYKGEKDWEWYNLEQDNGYKGAIDPMPYLNLSEDKEKIKELQTLLNKYGARLVVDGIWGKLSKQALEDFLIS